MKSMWCRERKGDEEKYEGLERGMGLGGMSEEWVCMKSMWCRERKGDEKNMKA